MVLPVNFIIFVYNCAQNTERYGASLRIQSEYRKIRTRNNSVFGHISRSENVLNSSSFTALRIVAKFHSGDRWFSDNFSEKLIYLL